MSIIVWDRKSIAADRQGTTYGMRYAAQKLHRVLTVEGTMALACVGNEEAAHLLFAWYKAGCKKDEWPALVQSDKENNAYLIVATRKGCVVYQRQPVAIAVLDEFIAWGSGRDYAMGAMAKGATAREAVEIACRFDVSCGIGVDEIRFDDAR
jgi:ATP-dependent protease HslVU (ClpYQ) peptidase subunit